MTRPTVENDSCTSLTGTITAFAETEFASLDCVFDEELLLLSSDTVGIAVGVDAVAVQAESDSAVIIRKRLVANNRLRLPLGLRSLHWPDLLSKSRAVPG